MICTHLCYIFSLYLLYREVHLGKIQSCRVALPPISSCRFHRQMWVLLPSIRLSTCIKTHVCRSAKCKIDNLAAKSHPEYHYISLFTTGDQLSCWYHSNNSQSNRSVIPPGRTQHIKYTNQLCNLATRHFLWRHESPVRLDFPKLRTCRGDVCEQTLFPTADRSCSISRRMHG